MWFKNRRRATVGCSTLIRAWSLYKRVVSAARHARVTVPLPHGISWHNEFKIYDVQKCRGRNHRRRRVARFFLLRGFTHDTGVNYSGLEVRKKVPVRTILTSPLSLLVYCCLPIKWARALAVHLRLIYLLATCLVGIRKTRQPEREKSWQNVINCSWTAYLITTTLVSVQ